MCFTATLCRGNTARVSSGRTRPNPSRGKRPPAEVIDGQVQQALRELRKGLSGGSVTRSLALKFKDEWGKSLRRAQDVVGKALKIITAEQRAEVPELRAQAINSTDVVFEKALKAKDWRAAMKALEHKNKLEGLLVDRVEHSGGVDVEVMSMTPQQRLERLAAMTGVTVDVLRARILESRKAKQN